ncbi:hypothetical protein EVAR_74684_1 [Eumeta japonica]|uniref:Regulatory protein zeste n=1 Tax=Eumeta variegata TaxID=151549 RepID=A0A4C1YMR9_EUMVA|nr:hypothetical protein EVAR_74684_1 [Eumeta japonica]
MKPGSEPWAHTRTCTRSRVQRTRNGLCVKYAKCMDPIIMHGDLSKSQGGFPRRLRAELLWRELTVVLNSVRGGVKKSKENGKVWIDCKAKAKKKYFSIRQRASGTVGDPSIRQSLTALEKRVVAILGFSAIVGQAGTKEHGFNKPSQPTEKSICQSEKSETQFVLEVPYAYYSSVLTSQSQPSQSTPLVLPSPSSPPLPRSPPPQVSDSSPSFVNSSRHRVLLGSCRNCRLRPVHQAASKFVTVEQRRLELEEVRDKRLHEREEARDRRLHEREMERLRLDSLQTELFYYLPSYRVCRVHAWHGARGGATAVAISRVSAPLNSLFVLRLCGGRQLAVLRARVI